MRAYLLLDLLNGETESRSLKELLSTTQAQRWLGTIILMPGERVTIWRGDPAPVNTPEVM